MSEAGVRGRGRYIDCGRTRGEGGMYGRTGISDTRPIVAPGVISSSMRGVIEGVELVEPFRSDETLPSSSRGDGKASIRRGTSRVLSVLGMKMRDSPSRGLPRVRGWLGRDLGAFERGPKELMKTRVGRVGGSFIVTFLAV